jgi:hypothetical protein
MTTWTTPLVLAVLTLCVLAGCGGCRGGAGVDAGRDAGGPRTLTEADTTPLDGGVLAGSDAGWTLTLPTPGWQRVSPEARARLGSRADEWAVEPSSEAQVTVTCGAGRGAEADDVRAALEARAQAAGRDVQVRAEEPLDGPWLRGALARFDSTVGGAGFRHAVGVFDLGEVGCEVQAWEPRRDPEGATQPLDAIVRAFRPQVSRAARVAARLTRQLREDLALGARLAEQLDAGLTPAQALSGLVSLGLGRLPDAALEERATLRLALLARLDPDVCAALVLQREELAPGWLDALTEEEVDGWARLSEAALAAADAPERPVERRAAEALERRLAGADPDFQKAVAVLSAVDRAPSADICRAERVRLQLALARPARERALLLRAWLGL